MLILLIKKDKGYGGSLGRHEQGSLKRTKGTSSHKVSTTIMFVATQ